MTFCGQHRFMLLPRNTPTGSHPSPYYPGFAFAHPDQFQAMVETGVGDGTCDLLRSVVLIVK